MNIRILALVCAIGVGGCAVDTPNGLINDAGYIAFKPYATNGGPGSLNHVAQLAGGDYARIDEICLVNAEDRIALTESWRPETSPFQTLERGRFEFSEKRIDAVNAAAGAAAVKSVFVEFANVRINRVTDTGMKYLQDRYLKGNCGAGLPVRLGRGDKVCQMRTVVTADVSYRILFSEMRDDDVKRRALGAINPTLLENATTEEKGVIRVDGLHIGFQDFDTCLKLEPDSQVVFAPSAGG